MIKRNVKDNLFTHMFGDDSKAYLLQLYQALHPEDKDTNEDDLTLVSIENVLANDIYNDLGFMVNDKLVVLVEAQSTWSSNIIIRMFLYLAKTYQAYIYKNLDLRARIYSKSKIEIPEAEMYVLYAGKKGDKPEVISLKEEFFNSNATVDLSAKVLYADEERDNIIGEYLAFCTILKDQLLLYNGDKQKAIQETIRICIAQGKLVEYLSEHRREVEDYMFALMSQEELYESYGDYRESVGREQGASDAKIEALRNLMNNLDMSVEEAMKSMGIPEAEWEAYKAKI